jgi:hypothetical protein
VGWGHAAKSIGRTSVGIGVAAGDVQRERLATCRVCPQKKGQLCAMCGCIRYLKARDARETCPLGYWRR